MKTNAADASDEANSNQDGNVTKDAEMMMLTTMSVMAVRKLTATLDAAIAASLVIISQDSVWPITASKACLLFISSVNTLRKQEKKPNSMLFTSPNFM